MASKPAKIRHWQREVDEWIQRFTEGYWQPLAIHARLSEEVGELARELNHRFGPKKKKASELENDLGIEMADILFTLFCLANREGIDLDQKMQAVMDKYRGRDNRRFERKSRK